jgi:putative serine/threonine protein kinase
MEFIDGMPLKAFENTDDYYKILQDALYNAFLLDEKGVFHGQLGRYYHIFKTEEGVKFIDFERGVFTENPRNFMQITGYYLFRDQKFNKTELEEAVKIYKQQRKKGLQIISDMINCVINGF